MSNYMKGLRKLAGKYHISVMSEGELIAQTHPKQKPEQKPEPEPKKPEMKEYPMPEVGEVAQISEEICKHLEVAKLYKAQIDDWRESLKRISANLEALQKIWEGGSREVTYDGTQYFDEYQNPLITFLSIGEVIASLTKQIDLIEE